MHDDDFIEDQNYEADFAAYVAAQSPYDFETDYEAHLAAQEGRDYEADLADYDRSQRYGPIEPWALCDPGCYWCYGKALRFWEYLNDFADDVLSAKNLQKLKDFEERVEYRVREENEIRNLGEAVQLAYEIKAFEKPYWDWVNNVEGDPFTKDPRWLTWTGLTDEEELALLQIDVPPLTEQDEFEVVHGLTPEAIYQQGLETIEAMRAERRRRADHLLSLVVEEPKPQPRRGGAGFEPLVFFDQDKHDHYQRVGEGPCEDRVPAGSFYKGPIPVPRDAHVQCKTCANAARCFAFEQDVEDPDILDGEHQIDESEWSDNY